MWLHEFAKCSSFPNSPQFMFQNPNSFTQTELTQGGVLSLSSFPGLFLVPVTEVQT